ncbi:hypothetical protein [Burkholderia glumae]|uniref:Uncharacterized protein n=1 Tax=Burkholderia glumae TaxID=337 RepID=A0AAQ0BT56_BURGL|nr:hypothetical protein [Burkholderia glumae]AJY66061.1 hypothetical protein KS03_906 [Burkholderia glumae LMG 2196 = ATCC 33617]PNL00120.1 hypothetical protein CEQ24_013210 [Burkholderia glumae]QJP73110.1 hypothetical protein HJC54_23955 [Burkholderia glumae]QPQ92020.1 hypothetical protein I6H06_23250 [Burkholderia glumae]QQM89768.1 hypothetical protein I6G78_11385 [Burkholderia glumae]
MISIHAHIEASATPGFVLLRTSASADPERKPAMLVSRAALPGVLLLLLDAAAHFDYDVLEVPHA